MSSPSIRAYLALCLVAVACLSPWDRGSRFQPTDSCPHGASHPAHRRPLRSLSFAPMFAHALHNDNFTAANNIVPRDPATGALMGDLTSGPTRSTVGFVQDCPGLPGSTQGASSGGTGTLCGARGAYLAGHHLWVAAAASDAVTVVDVQRPEMPTVAGSVRDATRLKQVVATWMHRSAEYVVALARGRRPASDGHVTLVDVRPERWVKDQAGRFLAQPRVVSHLKDCATSEDPTFKRKLGRLCGARAMHVVDDLAYVVSEVTHTLSIVRLPERLSDDHMGLPPRTLFPEFVGSVQDGRLDGAHAVTVWKNNAYVASRWCKTCVVLVNVLNPAAPAVGGR